MAISIQNEEVERLRRLRTIDERRRQVIELAVRYQSRLSGTVPHPDDILGYDDDGLPR